MNSFFLGTQRSWILMFVGWILWTHPGLAETASKMIEMGPTGQADLSLEFTTFPPPIAAPCCEVLYRTSVTNHGPDSTDVNVQLDFLGGALEYTVGCLNDLQGNGECQLGTLSVGESRPVMFSVSTTACGPTTVNFRGLALGSVPDPVLGNNELALTTQVGPDTPPTLTIEQPQDGTVIAFDPSTHLDLVATVIDAEEEEGPLNQSIEWRTDRVGNLQEVGSPISVGLDVLGLGGHTLTATVTDRCDNTTSAEVSIGVEPKDPISTGASVTFDTDGEQGQPDIASIGDDAFVVVWSEIDVNDIQDIDGSVQVQRFNSEGVPLDEPTQVNIGTEGLQHRPAVAGWPDGSFIVTWEGPSTEVGETATDIFLRRFDNQGEPSPNELQVNIDPTGRQQHPDVASHRDGSFLVAWEDGAPGDSEGDLVARYFDSSGNAQEEFPINSFIPGRQERPNIIFEPTGGFIVAWQSEGSRQDDNDGYSIQLRLFDAPSQPLGPEFQVNQAIEGDQTAPSMDINLEGRTVVVWKSTTTSDAQKRTLRIAGVSRDLTGGWDRPEVEFIDPILPTPDNPFPELSPPDVAVSPDGDFVVIWADGPEAGPFNVRARPVFGLGDTPVPFGAPLLLDDNGLGLPAIAYNRSNSDSTNFFAFWGMEGDQTSATPEGPIEAMDLMGNELLLAFGARVTTLWFTANVTPNPVVQGRTLTFNIQVENRGAAPSVDNVVRLFVSNLWDFFSFPGCVRETPLPNVTCRLGVLQEGETWQLSLPGQVHEDSSSEGFFTIDVSSGTPLTPNEPTPISGSIDVISAPLGSLFFDSFESGDTGSWSDATPFEGNLETPRIED